MMTIDLARMLRSEMRTTPHTGHAVLTVLTLGAWAIVWLGCFVYDWHHNYKLADLGRQIIVDHNHFVGNGVDPSHMYWRRYSKYGVSLRIVRVIK